MKLWHRRRQFPGRLRTQRQVVRAVPSALDLRIAHQVFAISLHELAIDLHGPPRGAGLDGATPRLIRALPLAGADVT